MAKPVFVQGSLRVLGTGMAVPTCPTPVGPKSVITNDDLVTILTDGDTPERRRRAVARMIEDFGAQTRHWSHWIGSPPHPQEPTTVDLALEAARAALADAGLSPADLDLVILALSTSTLPTIATATPLCQALGYQGPSLDVKAGCAGSLYALQLASSLIASGYGRILVVGADTMSKYVDAEALAGFINVADGAGAVVVGPGAAGNFTSMITGEYSTWDTAGVLDTLPPKAPFGEAFVFRGKPSQLKELIVERYRESLQALLDHTGLGFGDLQAWLPHQIAPAVLDAIWHSFEAPTVRMLRNHEHYGNTGAASLLIALHEFRCDLAGSRVALSALGGGMRWGAAIWKDMV